MLPVVGIVGATVGLEVAMLRPVLVLMLAGIALSD